MCEVPELLQEELLSEDVKSCLEKIILEQCVKNYTLDISSGSSKGDNFLGIIVKVVEAGENALDPQIMPVLDIYHREILIYETVLKEFTNFQEDKMISKPFNSFAKYYASLINESNEALIMEDMKELGYELQDKRKNFNYDQALIAAREYGKFHAISFALRDQKPELFHKLSENLEDVVFRDSFTKGPMRETIDAQCKLALASLDPVEDKVAYEKFKKFIESVVDKLQGYVSSEAAGKYAVIGHGDCGKNNMLFKYENKEKPESPTKICFLDWAVLIREYYNSLATHLKELGSDPEKLFPFEALEEQLVEFGLFGLYLSVSILVVIVSEGKDVLDFESMSQDSIKVFVPVEEATKIYNARVRGIILDFVKYNYL